jgi:hypothetical protein
MKERKTAGTEAERIFEEYSPSAADTGKVTNSLATE